MFNNKPQEWYEVYETRADGVKETLFRNSNLSACQDYIDRNKYFKLLNIDQWKQLKHGPVVVKNVTAPIVNKLFT
jgi:hypothetical protein